MNNRKKVFDPGGASNLIVDRRIKKQSLRKRIDRRKKKRRNGEVV